MQCFSTPTGKDCPKWDCRRQGVQDSLLHQVPWLSHGSGGIIFLVPRKGEEVRIPPKDVVGKSIQVVYSPLVGVPIELFDISRELSPTLCHPLGMVVDSPWYQSKDSDVR